MPGQARGLQPHLEEEDVQRGPQGWDPDSISRKKPGHEGHLAAKSFRRQI